MQKTDEQKSAVLHRKIQISDGKDRKSLVRPVTVKIDLTQKGDIDNALEGFLNDKVVEKATTSSQQSTNKETEQKEAKKSTQALNKLSQVAKKVAPKKRMRKYPPVQFGAKRVLFALACAVVIVAVIVCIVDRTAPDMSDKVQAMAPSAVYPKYTPRCYSVSDVTSDEEKVVLNFHCEELSGAYTLTERKVNLGNNVTLEQYVNENYGNNYNKYTEQGIDVYIAGRGAVWINDNVLYELMITSGNLTRKQILTIATTEQ